MTTIAIMQPTYLPWLGYFGLMERVDVFVFLDCTQFSRRSWQQRNKIKTQHGEKIITLPVEKSNRDQQIISKTVLSNPSENLKKHYNLICQSYRKAKYFNKYSDELNSIYSDQNKYLTDINIKLIKLLCKHFNITTETICSSSLGVHGQKADRLANICKALNALEYISVEGSRGYIQESTAFSDNDISVAYHQYEHPIYHQLHGEFLPYMGAIDLLFNEGIKSENILKNSNLETTK